VTRLLVDAAAIEEAARIIRAGGIVALPTDTLYGLAVDPFRADAVARVFAVKGRPVERPLPLIAGDLAQVERAIAPLPPMGLALARAFWPGPLTLLLDAPPTLAPDVTAGTGRVGVRVPAQPVARALCHACATPLTATSANISGEPPSDDPNEIERTIGARIDVLLDAGHTAGGPPSTIVDVTGTAPRLVREGAVGWNEVLACVHRA
jgi:L-threonylcarbamoyladenylate synthase